MKDDIKLMSFVIIRRLIYISLAAIDRLLGKINPIVILCYHSIADDNWRFSVSPKDFKKQISYMSASYKSVSLSDISNYLNGKKDLNKPSFVITFDDGYKNIFKIKNLLSDFSVKPVVFVLGASENKINWDSLGKKNLLLSKMDIKKLQKSGWEIGYHGMTHTPLTQLEGCNLKEEISSSYKYFAYPKGKYSNGIASDLKKIGYKLAMTMDDSLISTKTNPYYVPRIGVDRTHNFSEFKRLSSPSVVKLRSLIKHSFLGRYL